MDLYSENSRSKLIDKEEFSLLFDACVENKVTTIDFLILSPNELSKKLKRSINEIVLFQNELIKEFDSINDHFIQLIKTKNEVSIENDKLAQDTLINYPNISKQPDIRSNILTNSRQSLKSNQHYNDIQHFTTGDPKIDQLLNGGIYTHEITEVFGESSSGKTQFLLQLSLNVQLGIEKGGLDGSCVFITTEGDLPTRRLEDLIVENKKYKSYQFEKNDFLYYSQEKIYTVSCNDLISQDHILNVQLPILLERNPNIKLVIIDSISHHMRVELQIPRKRYNNLNTKTHPKSNFDDMYRQIQDNKKYIDNSAENLLKLSHKYGISIVLSNQVSDKPLKFYNNNYCPKIWDYEYQLGWLVGWNKRSIKARQCRNNRNNSYTLKVETQVPNLGLTWSNHVSTRILLSKSYKAIPLVKDSNQYRNTDASENSEGNKTFWQIRRNFKVIYSRHCKNDDINFVITRRGVNSVFD
ncbi:hypothetical protein TBLA_0A00120 [Henningerozyma blattae CBS 6284]|uniref:RecA family profile 1 domain-containing protein n=1 Tax=Henningerozyma blattae (strain ATCC 34711 / CBS 6284 / DSM 70876 / NBRC 10599 / NRRL Y-10934 / UCD 77-7) TaxID=1071380 RepID=I2GUL2_HENB6|nr:hypothetical protein TBLA_0A00120 [Tetrapisispora blattae CBS 6284]CCH57814.1 hypothetical protein TBLA_0A00120 [Tetrapisispora blattae CBS 6284]